MSSIGSGGEASASAATFLMIGGAGRQTIRAVAGNRTGAGCARGAVTKDWRRGVIAARSRLLRRCRLPRYTAPTQHSCHRTQSSRLRADYEAKTGGGAARHGKNKPR